MSTRALDHIVLVVPDLDSAAGELETIGFTVTPTSHHPFGTANRLIMLQDSYLELVTVTDRSAIGTSAFAGFVADAEASGRFGPVMLVLASDDVGSDQARLQSLGLDSPDPVQFGRMATQPNGEATRVEFETLFTSIGSDTFNAFYCHHLTREAVWTRSSTQHLNGGQHFIEVTIPDPGAEPLARFAAMAETDVTDGEVVLANCIVSVGDPSIRITGARTATVRIADTNIHLVGS